MTAAFVVLGALLALVLLSAGVVKLAGAERMRDAAERFGIAWPRYRLIGGVELAAVVGLAVGFAWRPVGLAAGCGTGALMVGALAYHHRADDPPAEMLGAAVTLALAVAYVVTGFVTLS